MHRVRTGPVLIALPTGRDGPLAAETLSRAHVPNQICPNLAALTQAIGPETGALLLAEETLLGRDVEPFLDALRKQGAWSDLPVLYLTRQQTHGVREQLPNRQLLEVTYVMLLDRPVRGATLISAVEAAMRARQRQWQVRDLLEENRQTQADLELAKQEAEAASRAKDEFLAALSHELRTPLTPVLMTATTLRNDERLPADVREDLAMVERNVGLEARLIDDLLDLTRVTTGKFPMRWEDCDVHSLIGHAVEIVRDEAQCKPVRVEMALGAQRYALRGDAARLQQVVWNLLKNAIKFTEPGGRVTVRTADGGDHLQLEVSDTGLGFADGAGEKIFQPFEQAGREGHRFGGLGLGLAITRAIVHMHGGKIRASSAGIGRGATFVVQLPGAHLPEPKALDGKSPALDGASLPRPFRLLVVEDHAATLEVIRRLLTRAGHTVAVARSISEAAEYVRKSGAQLDVMISDLGLPDGTGLQLMEQVQAVRPGLPAIALSGYGMEEDLARTRAAGFHAHLVKPIDFQQLLRTLETVPAPVAPLR